MTPASAIATVLLLLLLLQLSAAVSALSTDTPIVITVNRTVQTGFQPSIGNGFLSGDVGCCVCPTDSSRSKGEDNGHDKARASCDSSCGMLRIGGVFSRNMPLNVPQRARLGNPHAIYVTSASRIVNGAEPAHSPDGTASVQWLSASLDITNAAVYNDTAVSEGDRGNQSDTAFVRVTKFTHRKYRQLLVTQVAVHTSTSSDSHSNTNINTLTNASAASYRVAIANCEFSSTEDFEVVSSLRDDDRNMTVTVFKIRRMPELPPYATKPQPSIFTGPTMVAVGYQAVPQVLTADAANPATFRLVVRTTLETDVTPDNIGQTAMDDLKSFAAMSYEQLWQEHTNAWEQLYNGSVRVESRNDTVRNSVAASVYALYSAVRADWPYGLSPGGLARDSYNGHSFWDCETWMLPNFVAFHPAIAASLVQYRIDRLHAARDTARHAGMAGAKWPWESALSGYGVVRPNGDDIFDIHEIHISGDIPYGIGLYHRMNGNLTWLKTSGAWDVIHDSALYFASRVVREPSSGNYTLYNVVTPDEGAGVVNNSAYTNALAAKVMILARDLGKAINRTVPENFTTIAEAIYLPLTTFNGTTVHLEFEGYHGQNINQADVALLQYPLYWPMPSWLAKNDLVYYEPKASTPGTAGFYTGDSAYAVAWLALGNRTAADHQFYSAIRHMDTSGYYVWQEKDFPNDPGHLNFITGAGGYAQSFLWGYLGLRYSGHGSFTLNTVLPPQVDRLTAQGLRLGQAAVTVSCTDSRLDLDLVNFQVPLSVVDATGNHYSLTAASPSLSLPLSGTQPVTVSLT